MAERPVPQAPPDPSPRPRNWLPGLLCPLCGQARLESYAKRNQARCPQCGVERPIITYG